MPAVQRSRAFLLGTKVFAAMLLAGFIASPLTELVRAAVYPRPDLPGLGWTITDFWKGLAPGSLFLATVVMPVAFILAWPGNNWNTGRRLFIGAVVGALAGFAAMSLLLVLVEIAQSQTDAIKPEYFIACVIGLLYGFPLGLVLGLTTAAIFKVTERSFVRALLWLIAVLIPLAVARGFLS